MADAEAITEAGSRPTMRFVEVKTPEQQGLGMIFRLRDLLVGQRTQAINALRGHLAEFGLVAAKGRENVDKLRAVLKPSQEWVDDLPPAVRHMAQLCFDQVDDLSRRIAQLDAQIAADLVFLLACKRCLGSAPLPRWHWRLLLHQWRLSAKDVIFRLGWVSFHDNIPAAASKGLDARASLVSATSGAC